MRSGPVSLNRGNGMDRHNDHLKPISQPARRHGTCVSTDAVTASCERDDTCGLWTVDRCRGDTHTVYAQNLHSYLFLAYGRLKAVRVTTGGPVIERPSRRVFGGLLERCCAASNAELELLTTVCVMVWCCIGIRSRADEIHPSIPNHRMCR